MIAEKDTAIRKESEKRERELAAKDEATKKELAAKDNATKTELQAKDDEVGIVKVLQHYDNFLCR